MCGGRPPPPRREAEILARLTASAGREKAQIPAAFDRIGPLRYTKFAVKATLVGLHGVERDVQACADLSSRQGCGQQSQELQLLAGQLLGERGYCQVRARGPGRLPGGTSSAAASSSRANPGSGQSRSSALASAALDRAASG